MSLQKNGQFGKKTQPADRQSSARQTVPKNAGYHRPDRAKLDAYEKKLSEKGFDYVDMPSSSGPAIAVDCPACGKPATSKKCTVKVGRTKLIIACPACGTSGDEMRAAMEEVGMPWVGGSASGWYYDAKFRHLVYTAVLNVMVLQKRHGKQLESRGFNAATIRALSVRSVGLGKYDSVDSHSQAVEYELHGLLEDDKQYDSLSEEKREELINQVPGVKVVDGSLEFALPRCPGIVFPTYNRFGLISRLRLRLDNPGEGGKYRFIGRSSSDDGHTTVHVPPLTLSRLGEAQRGSTPTQLIITEGELKAEWIVQKMKVPAISMSGVGSHRQAISCAAKLGVARIDWAFDADHRTNKNVAKAMISAFSVCRQQRLSCGVMLWDPKYKGIDDIPVAELATIRTLEGDDLRKYLKRLADQHSLEQPDDRPRISITPDGHSAAAEQINDRLGECGIYRLPDGTPAMVDGLTRQMTPLSADAFPAQVDRFCLFERPTPNGEVTPTSCPKELAKKAYYRWDYPGMPPITAFVPGPAVMSDGRLVTTPGYDQRTGAYVQAVPDGWDAQTHVISKPTLEQASMAYRELAELFVDFNFHDPAVPAAAVAAMLTIAGRQFINGNVPMFVFTAARPRSGKTLMAQAIAEIGTGRTDGNGAANYAQKRRRTKEDAIRRGDQWSVGGAVR
ncbi:MAG: DUF3854 domain-containing protein [Candidatus Paceibacterota bacterium]